MQVGKIKNKAKKFLSVNKYHPLLLNAAIIALVVVILMFTFALSHISRWRWLMWYGVVLLVAFYVFTAPVEYSATDFYLRSYNLKYTENFKLFEGFKKENFWRSVLIRLIRTGLGIGFTVLLIVPGVMFLLRTAFVYFVVNNNPKTNAWDAVRESNQLVKGHTLELFKVSLSFTGWFLLGIISLGFGFIYVSPYYHTVKSIFYRNVIMGVNDAGVKIPSTGGSSQKNVDSEIAELEKQIKAMEKGNAANASAPKVKPQTNPAETAPKSAPAENAIVEEVSEPISDIPQEVTAEEVVAIEEETTPITDGEPLVLDEVGDVMLNSGDRVEEVELPDVKINTDEKTAPKSGGAEFVSREVEIMENESFEDFKARITKLRRERDGKASAAVPPRAGQSAGAAQSAHTPPKTGQSAQPNDSQRRPTREEILEKLRRERNNK